MFYMASTKIPCEQTAGEIQALLGKSGARQVLTEYENGEVMAISFMIENGGKQIPFRLPLRWEACLEAMKRDRQTANHLCNEVQAKRTAWRIILRWVQAQFALIETGMVTLTEVMLPYLQVDAKATLYEKMIDNQFKLLPAK